jgi:hypothetical protein
MPSPSPYLPIQPYQAKEDQSSLTETKKKQLCLVLSRSTGVTTQIKNSPLMRLDRNQLILQRTSLQLIQSHYNPQRSTYPDPPKSAMSLQPQMRTPVTAEPRQEDKRPYKALQGTRQPQQMISRTLHNCQGPYTTVIDNNHEHYNPILKDAMQYNPQRSTYPDPPKSAMSLQPQMRTPVTAQVTH